MTYPGEQSSGFLPEVPGERPDYFDVSRIKEGLRVGALQRQGKFILTGDEFEGLPVWALVVHGDDKYLVDAPKDEIIRPVGMPASSPAIANGNPPTPSRAQRPPRQPGNGNVFSMLAGRGGKQEMSGTRKWVERGAVMFVAPYALFAVMFQQSPFAMANYAAEETIAVAHDVGAVIHVGSKVVGFVS
jgi:hypothetical protein